MPFGLTCAMSSYQRLVNHILKPHKNTCILVDLDELFFVTHLKITYNTLTYLFFYLHPMTYAYDFKNVFLALNELKYLGNVDSKDGQRPSNNKIKVVSEWQRPNTVQETQPHSRFL
jgi:hypothetical protein